jgi:hypothetical protein
VELFALGSKRIVFAHPDVDGILAVKNTLVDVFLVTDLGPAAIAIIVARIIREFLG